MAVKNIGKALRLFSTKKVLDSAIRALDEEESWITVNGSHVKVDGSGNPVAGNKNVVSAMKGNGSNKQNPGKQRPRKRDDFSTQEEKDKFSREISERVSNKLLKAGSMYFYDKNVDKDKAKKLIKELKDLDEEYTNWRDIGAGYFNDAHKENISKAVNILEEMIKTGENGYKQKGKKRDIFLWPLE